MTGAGITFDTRLAKKGWPGMSSTRLIPDAAGPQGQIVIRPMQTAPNTVGTGPVPLSMADRMVTDGQRIVQGSGELE